jgi:hypothetical protein
LGFWQLIKDYRESRNIPLDLERRLIWGIPIESDDGYQSNGECLSLSLCCAGGIGSSAWPSLLITSLRADRPTRLDFDKLPLMQKVQIFGDALAQTQGEDISRMLWLRSQSSEVIHVMHAVCNAC